MSKGGLFMNEKDFDDLFQQNDELEEINGKKIQQGIRKNIYKRIVISLIVIALLVAGMYKGTSYLLDVIYYNPFHEEKLVDDNDKFSDDATFHIVFQTYCEMFFPGKNYLMVENMKSLGFGNYETRIKIHDLFDRLYIDGFSNMTLQIQQSHMHMETNENHLFSLIIDEFANRKSSVFDSSSYQITKNTLKEIEDLPDSSRLNVSFSFPRNYHLKETFDLINKYPDMTALWLATDSFLRDSSIADGMTLWKSTMYDLSPEAKKEYPYLYIDNNTQLNDETFLQYYLSNLKLLLDHPKEVNMIAEMMNNTATIESIQKIYDYVQKGFQVVGLKVNIYKKDLLKIIELENIDYMVIHDVKLSILQK